MKKEYPMFTDEVASELSGILVQYCPENWKSLVMDFRDTETGSKISIQILRNHEKACYVAIEEADADTIAEIMERAMPFDEEDCANQIIFTLHPGGDYNVQFNKRGE